MTRRAKDIAVLVTKINEYVAQFDKATTVEDKRLHLETISKRRETIHDYLDEERVQSVFSKMD